MSILSAAHGPMSEQLIVNASSQHSADLQSQQQQPHSTSIAMQIPVNVTLLMYCSSKGARPPWPIGTRKQKSSCASTAFSRTKEHGAVLDTSGAVCSLSEVPYIVLGSLPEISYWPPYLRFRTWPWAPYLGLHIWPWAPYLKSHTWPWAPYFRLHICPWAPYLGSHT